jgi:hypothetical protein
MRPGGAAAGPAPPTQRASFPRGPHSRRRSRGNGNAMNERVRALRTHFDAVWATVHEAFIEIPFR